METATRFGEDLQQAAKNVQEQLADTASRAQQRLKSGFGDTQDLLASLNGQIRQFVREQPILALAGAFFVGYVIARTARALQQ